MAKRKSVFELLISGENINLSVEYDTIEKLLRQPRNVNGWESIDGAIDAYIIEGWKYSNRCIELNDLRKKLKISNIEVVQSKYSVEKCLLYFELIYNLVKELILAYENPDDESVETIYEYDVYKILENIEGLLEDLNYIIKKVEDKYVIVEKDIIATAIAEKNPDIANDIIEYRRFNLKGDIETKKAIILKLADKIEPMRKKFKGTSYNSIMEDVQMMLNNLNLRHNNLEGKNKKEYTATISLEELENWYDKTYDMILGVLSLNDYLNSNDKIKELKTKF